MPRSAPSSQIAAAYDVVAEDYARLLPALEAEGPLEHAVVDLFAAGVTAGADPAVLDAGCGAGRLAGYLSGHGCRVTGIDLSAEMVRLAAEAHPGCRFDVGDLADLPYPGGTFAGVLSWYSIIHVPSEALDEVLDELVRVLAPGGLLLLAFQAGRGSRLIREAYGHQLALTAHLHDLGDVAALLEARGTGIEVCLDRAPRAHERHRQAFLMARRPH